MNDIRFTTDLLAEGWTATEIARLERLGELKRIRRGAYEPPPGSELGHRELHRRLIAATIRQTPVEAVLSHMSAAVLHGLPIWPSHLARVHLTRDQRGGGKIRRYTHLHVAPLPEVDVGMIDGFPVTTKARTVLDLLRCLPMEKGVPIGDAALRAGLSLEELAEVAGRCIGWRGVTQARRSLAFLDGRSESVGESSSRVVIHRLGLPAPTPQFEVFTDQGLLVGRADFGWEELPHARRVRRQDQVRRVAQAGPDHGQRAPRREATRGCPPRSRLADGPLDVEGPEPSAGAQGPARTSLRPRSAGRLSLAAR